jgi:hypothetical protein
MVEQSKMAKMVAMATPWMALLYEIGHLLLWMNEMYQDIKSIPEQLKVICQYLAELGACLDTLKRVCLPDGTETLHPDDIKNIIPISERATMKMRTAMQIIAVCAKSASKERSTWESICEIFSAPEWMQQKNTIAGLLQDVKQNIETISAITAANTHQKVCDMQQQIEEMKQMMKMGLEIRKSSRSTPSRQILSSTDSQGRNWSRHRRKKTSYLPSNALSPQDADPRTELEANLANLVAKIDEYIWYG